MSDPDAMTSRDDLVRQIEETEERKKDLEKNWTMPVRRLSVLTSASIVLSLTMSKCEHTSKSSSMPSIKQNEASDWCLRASAHGAVQSPNVPRNAHTHVSGCGRSRSQMKA